MKKLTGLITATFTPMDQDGQVNLEPIPAMVDGLLRQAIKGLYVCGSTGEGPSLTTGERERVAQAYVESARGRVPVVVQVGHNSVEDARRLAKHAASIGADAISAVPPSYFQPESVPVLIETLARITDAAPEIPFYYYHIPRFSGLSLDLLAFLETAPARIPSLAGIKFSSRDIEVMQRCLAFDNGRYNILFGVDEMLLSGLAAGCDGAVGSTYNFLAPLYHQVARDFEHGDLPAARAGQLKAAQLIAVIIRYHGNSGLKAVMTLAGVPCGPPRLPLPPLTAPELARMREELTALGFFTYAGQKTS
jgi:N-acetylneuraminate lyase